MNPAYGVIAIVLVCTVTLAIGAFGLRLSRTTSDFYVAGRTVTPYRNASAIGGEYLSAASFLGIAGLVYTNGLDMLWFPVGYTVGYVVLLVLVAAPLRRSGAYTLPDFAEARLESTVIRRLCSVLVVAIGWLYLLPQLQGAGLALGTVTGAPTWVGGLVVAVVVVANVAAGGMRSITLVQSVQYWVKLTAIAVPAFVLLGAWLGDGAPGPRAAQDSKWAEPLNGLAGQGHPVYATYSLLLALGLGTMGLPHVLVRFYTNPDGKAARRTTVTVVALLGAFYLFPPLYGVLGRVYLPDLASGTADTLVLRLPGAMVPDHLGETLSAVLAGGAFAAFLSTASGLTMSVAGVIDQDLLRRRLGRMTGDDFTVAQGFRLATVLSVLVPYAASRLIEPVGLATMVSLAFAVAASTFCPLLVLGSWWRGLSTVGAAAGLVVGGGLAAAAVCLTIFAGPIPGWPGALLGQPAAWTIPISFGTAVLVSLATPGRIPRHTARTMVRLHTPEDLALDRG
ncbi:cation/acetate symporter [Pedococcus dokdonensis]|uniref:Cation/acetate symporter n=1 Tax=Pedococcus dokdonensis TaxID=443156 RepID=A0A1H0UMT2_9MICO|nr:cation acetate symporter [Pedococcus dokdonensis]SDP67557.1 cation/acetate symporter [Pedococcus dokdonensis]